jgi:hypothetical protein
MSNAILLHLHHAATAAGAGRCVRGSLIGLSLPSSVRRAFPHPIDRGVTR